MKQPMTPDEFRQHLYAQKILGNGYVVPASNEYENLYRQYSALREALKQIRDWEPDYSPVEKIYDKAQAEGECKECHRRSEKGWPPSGLCDRHYGILQMEAPKARQDIYNGQHHDLKRIAFEALQGESK